MGRLKIRGKQPRELENLSQVAATVVIVTKSKIVLKILKRACVQLAINGKKIITCLAIFNQNGEERK